MKATIDRIEGGTATLVSREDGRVRVNLPISLLPPGSREGDIVTLALTRDEEETRAARERSAALIDRLERR